MMKHTILILSCLMSLSVSAQNIEAFVSQQMADYPHLHLIDIYKSCFQDYMGAEHLVTDREQVKAYLDKELNSTTPDELPSWYYEPCGTDGRFVRVSLKTVSEGLISEETLLDAFIRSADMKRPTVKSWSKKWHKMIKRIERMKLNLPEYDKEKQFIDSIISAGKYALSHSSDYRETYHPHYRIVERKIFEKELKPLLSNHRFPVIGHPIRKGDIQEHSPNVFLLMYDAEIGKEPVLKAIRDYKCEIVYDYNITPGMAIKKPDDKTLEETMRYFKSVKGVLTVEYDHIIRLTDPVRPRLEMR